MKRPNRLLEMLQLLGGRRPWRPAEIAEHFGISERSVYRDLQDLSRLYGIPVTNDEHGYRLVEGATLRTLPLTATERAALTVLLQQSALGAVSDLTEVLKQKIDAATREMEDTPHALTLAGPERSGEIAKGLVQLLERAIHGRTPVSLLYDSLWSRLQTWRGLNPYAMFHREQVWYLVGHCHVRNELRTFRLDRIADAKRLDGGFPKPAFDLDAFLRDVWGVFRGRATSEVVVHFDASLGPLLNSSSHHPGEKVKRMDNGALEYRVAISHFDEIARWIVTFGGAARAIGPPVLVARVAEIARGAYEQHQSDGQRPAGPDVQPDLPGLPVSSDDVTPASLLDEN